MKIKKYNKNKLTHKNIILLMLVIISLCLVINVSSQVKEEWVARYHGPGNFMDGAEAIAVDNWGNVYVSGWSYGLGTERDYATIKYNSIGIEQWVTRYSGSEGVNGWDSAYAIVTDSQGNIYVTGKVQDSGTYFDYATIKYNNSGAQQWVAIYNGTGNGEDRAHDIALDILGNIYVTGVSWDSGTSYDYATIKYNSLGEEQWVTRYNGQLNAEDWAYAIAVDSSGNVYVTGRSKGSEFCFDYATIKYDSDGVEQWVARYYSSEDRDDYAYDIAVDNEGNVYVTGLSSLSGISYDYATVKYNSLGVEQWVARYNGPGNSYDEANAIAIDISGNVYVTGYSSGGSETHFDYATIKYNSSGIEQWVARYNGPGNDDDKAYAIALDSSENIYVTGYSDGLETNRDYATIKYNSAGMEKWVARYDSPANSQDEAYAIAIDSSGNVYVTGMSSGSGTYDYATIKYSQNVAVNQNIWMNY